MLLLLFSPLLALFADYIRQRYSFTNAWTISIILLVTLPSLLVWLSGYSYSSRLGNYTAITVFIAGLVLAIYNSDSSEPRNKINSAIVLFFMIGIFILFSKFISIFSQHTDEVFSQTTFQNYKVVHSRDFDMVLHGPERVTIRKMKLNGLIEKQYSTLRFLIQTQYQIVHWF
jgi:hypothetical protein